MDVGTLVSCSEHGTGVVAASLGEHSECRLVDWFSGEKSIIDSAWVSQSVYKPSRDKKGYKKVKVWKLAGIEETHFVHVLSEIKR